MEEGGKNMDTKIYKYILQALNAVVLSGIILIFIGSYYCVVKAGIPYQDPPLELQIQYIIDMRIGEILLKKGLFMTICGGVVRLVLRWRNRFS